MQTQKPPTNQKRALTAEDVKKIRQQKIKTSPQKEVLKPGEERQQIIILEDVMAVKMEIDNILYKRQCIDRGVILGRVACKFDLSMHKTPCKLKHGRRLISKLTRHHKDPLVYVPVEFLEGLEGQEFEYICGDADSPYPVRCVWRLDRIGADYVIFEQIDRSEIVPKVSPRVENSPRVVIRDAGDCWFMPADNHAPAVFVDSWRPVDVSPEMITRGNRMFHKKTSFCFIYAPAEKHLTGSPYQKIVPDNILADRFVVQGVEYDLLTGHACPVPADVPVKISPRYREILLAA
jgi:hypothetical protein